MPCGAAEDGLARHTEDGARRFVLGHGERATAAELAQPLCAVASDACQQTPDGAVAVALGDGFEEHVDRRTTRMARWLAGEEEHVLANDQMAVRRADVHVAGLEDERVG